MVTVEEALGILEFTVLPLLRAKISFRLAWVFWSLSFWAYQGQTRQTRQAFGFVRRVDDDGFALETFANRIGRVGSK